MILQEVIVRRKDIDSYRKIVGDEVIDRLKALSRPLKGKRLIHINSTSRGGGVAEILTSLVPLQQDLGLDARWYVVSPPAPFFKITKKFHNALQGANVPISKEELAYYLKFNERFALALDPLPKDLLVIHDPQPLALRHYSDRETPAISRIHIDLSTPSPGLLKFFLPFLNEYDRVIFSLPIFISQGLEGGRTVIIPPAIDPLTSKNKPMSQKAAKKVLADLGIDTGRPIVAQVSRFDPWKDPIGVIDAYRLARKKIKGLQLILLGNATAKDDPESAMMIKKVKKHARADPDIHLVNIDSDMLVSAAQTGADVVLQKSIREGFGLTATEALWKGKTVIAGRVSGLAFQIEDGKSGILVDSPAEAGRAIVKVLGDKKLREKLSRAAHERVLRNFLITRLIWDHHRLYRDVLGLL